ncbi:MAG: bystin-domain-containing protein [Amphiamblys sp. WSBS2006]|nr:MAG: bystin-domain-containing protein [Amphiamblys sp. WSBS2006]
METEERIFAVYGKAGELLSRYRSGEPPRALKILPMLPNCEELLEIMLPERWTPAGVLLATTLFVNSKNVNLRHFLASVLLPAARQDFAENKKLSRNHYDAVRAALFKPQEFFRGFVLPMCEDRGTSSKEAAIIAGIVSKKHVPMLHVSAVLVLLAEKKYSGAVGVFLRMFLKKQTRLPCQALDSLFVFFYLERDCAEKKPVLWLQCLLEFVRGYSTDLSPEQREMLADAVSRLRLVHAAEPSQGTTAILDFCHQFFYRQRLSPCL